MCMFRRWWDYIEEKNWPVAECTQSGPAKILVYLEIEVYLDLLHRRTRPN
jgi:hypothetical protein